MQSGQEPEFPDQIQVLALCSLALDLRPDTAGQQLSKHWNRAACRAVSRERLGGHDQALRGWGTRVRKVWLEKEGDFWNTRLDTICQSACSQEVGDAVYRWVPSVVPDQQHQQAWELVGNAIAQPSPDRKPVESDALEVGRSHLWVSKPLGDADAAQG